MALLANTIYTRLTQKKEKTAGHRNVPFLIPQDVQKVIESSGGPTAETVPPLLPWMSWIVRERLIRT